MEQILLTPEEMVEALKSIGKNADLSWVGLEEEAVAKAQLKKVAEKMDERVVCEHLVFYHKRVSCERCWQALCKEAELEG